MEIHESLRSIHGPYVHRESGRRVYFPYKYKKGRYPKAANVEEYVEIGPDDSIIAIPPVPDGWILWSYEGEPDQHHPKDRMREAQRRLREV